MYYSLKVQKRWKEKSKFLHRTSSEIPTLEEVDCRLVMRCYIIIVNKVIFIILFKRLLDVLFS